MVLAGRQIFRAGKQISEELGRDPDSTDLLRRHPFDVEIARIPAGTAPFPYHFHTAQWEFYHVISGSGTVRDEDGVHPIRAGDAFVFKPGEAHQIRAGAEADLVLYCVADNPISDNGFMPDSQKWLVGMPDARCWVRAAAVGRFDGEE